MLVAVLLCLIMGIFSALSGGRISPVSNLVNILTTPIQKAVSGIGDSVSGFYQKISEYDQMKAENESLRQTLSDTEKKLRDAEKASKENEQLRAALNMKQRNESFVFEPAEIIARGNDNVTATLSLIHIY